MEQHRLSDAMFAPRYIESPNHKQDFFLLAIFFLLLSVSQLIAFVHQIAFTLSLQPRKTERKYNIYFFMERERERAPALKWNLLHDKNFVRYLPTGKCPIACVYKIVFKMWIFWLELVCLWMWILNTRTHKRTHIHAQIMLLHSMGLTIEVG